MSTQALLKNSPFTALHTASKSVSGVPTNPHYGWLCYTIVEQSSTAGHPMKWAWPLNDLVQEQWNLFKPRTILANFKIIQMKGLRVVTRATDILRKGCKGVELHPFPSPHPPKCGLTSVRLVELSIVLYILHHYRSPLLGNSIDDTNHSARKQPTSVPRQLQGCVILCRQCCTTSPVEASRRGLLLLPAHKSGIPRWCCSPHCYSSNHEMSIM